MAEHNGQTRTEAPTQRRREEARNQGQFAFSSELGNGAQLLAGVLALAWGGRSLAASLLDVMRVDLSAIDRFELSVDQVPGLAAWLFMRAAGAVGFFVGFVLVMGLVVSTVQVGFQVTPELLGLRWNRLSPAAGWSRMFSVAASVRGLMAVLKVVALAWVAWWVLRGRGPLIANLSELTLATALAQTWDIMMRLALAAGAALVLIGLADYVVQRVRHEQSLRMTREELKEELKRDEGDPQTRARLRRAARQIAHQQMMHDVPSATVVITNPTHLAIALRYERGVTAAPRIVAKGAGAVAHRIVSLARSHAVPVIERKPLAQALFKTVKVGQEIPAALYYAVAEVLAYVYRLRTAA
jgi:flagellar biosynthetic protein FlhB